MVRSNYYTQPYRKEIETFTEFSGGMNSFAPNGDLRDNEMALIKNKDLGNRGSFLRRYGMVKSLTVPVSGKGQGYFRYFRTDGDYTDIEAVNGKLYANRNLIPLFTNTGWTFNPAQTIVDKTDGELIYTALVTGYVAKIDVVVKENTVYMPTWTGSSHQATFLNAGGGVISTIPLVNGTAITTPALTTKIRHEIMGTLGETVTVKDLLLNEGTTKGALIEQPITSLPNGFQTNKPIEAVQFYTKMYFATGTKLIVFDGTTFAVVSTYAPTPLEGLYYGFNALASDPTNYMTDTTGPGLSAAGITFSSRYGLVNTPITITGYTISPSGWSLEHKLEYRTSKMAEGTWTLVRDFSSSKVFTFTPTTTDDHQFKYSVRQVGQTAVYFYQIPKFTVKAAVEPNDVPPDVSTIHSCNRILVNMDRLFLYGDAKNIDTVYISHAENPIYFPVPNTIKFSNPQNEPISVVLNYRDRMIIMTDTSIQALVGTSPLDYRKVMLNTQVGCIAPYSAVVVENFIYFLSQDGVYRLKQVGMTEDRANVDKLDTPISNVMLKDRDACGIFHDLQYHITFPSKLQRFRYYNELNAWVMDSSPKLDFNNMYVFNSLLYGQSKVNGNVFKFDKTVYNDDGYVYVEELQTKAYSFNQPYHPKTMRELLISISPKLGEFKAKLTVTIDDIPILKSSGGDAIVGSDGYVTWVPYDKDNIQTKNGTILGEWKLGEHPLGEVDKIMVKQALAGKGLEIKVNIKQDTDTANEIFGFSFIFKVKKPK